MDNIVRLEIFPPGHFYTLSANILSLVWVNIHHLPICCIQNDTMTREERRRGGGRVQRRWTRLFTLSVEETSEVAYIISLLPHLASCSFSYFGFFQFQITVNQVYRSVFRPDVEWWQWWCRPGSIIDILLDLPMMASIQNQQVRDEDYDGDDELIAPILFTSFIVMR